ncbi:4-phosphoerythronate dehydrogenase [Thioflexithrix psekupsensis]|uniref:Erythronate-4-phosphate dehydrogenase n=1 Tax=Thioflexithrix psekupsensis TaxID=1570016 RepID=A0A251X3Q5_9GAMM|nr:4-phosphoerythronate dehydrogenase [Thioflexithrix psekupsensis]OUD12020.1 hypothetical protein TPSD3_12855 [Thioflexithrix psekupsensis]
MQIVADENIPYVREAFADLGDVRTVSGRELHAEQVIDADVLLVRSVTAVNRELLSGSRVRFVGTATIGTDHIDVDWLRANQIAFASAPGCNAVSAAEYVISSLLVLAQQDNFRLTDKTVGIIGCGNVGSRVYQRLQTLGVTCLCHDPPLAAQNPKDTHRVWVDRATVLQADILTVHVPLTLSGEYATAQLINTDFLKKVSDRVILFNTSRGRVLDEVALQQAWLQQKQRVAVLDVWRGEPHLNPQTVALARLATPHIAGYSFDGKVRGTRLLAEAIYGYFGQSLRWQVSLPEPAITELHFSDHISDEQALYYAATACYDPRRDDAALRHSITREDAGLAFDQLRKYYPLRREFASLHLTIPTHRHALIEQLRGLGFRVNGWGEVLV